MPKISQYFVKISLLYLLVGFTIGALILIHKGIPFYGAIWSWLDIHVEVVLSGWILHLAMGTAYWMFPRFNPKKDDMEQRGYTWAIWTALIMLNGGILVYSTGSIMGYLVWGPFLGRMLQLVGVGCFVINLWPRTKPVSKPS